MSKTFNRSRNTVTMSGLCVECLEGWVLTRACEEMGLPLDELRDDEDTVHWRRLMLAEAMQMKEQSESHPGDGVQGVVFLLAAEFLLSRLFLWLLARFPAATP